MEQYLADFSAYINIFVAVGVYALTEAVKPSLQVKNQKYIPLMAVGMGAVATILLAVTAGENANDIVQAGITGCISGAAAVGVYEITKKKKNESESVE